MIIPYSEIHEILNGSYIDDGEEILTKHSAFNSEREFALVLIEQCMGLLSREVINDKFIVQYLQGLLALTNPESKHYEKFLNAFSPEPMLITKALNGEKLSIGDIAVVKELMQTNMAEYMMKGEYQRCCYSAMLAFFQAAYCILTKKIDFIIKHIDMIADLDDELESIQLYESSEGLKDVVTKSELADMMNSFISDDDEKWLMFNAKFSSADEVYESIYKQAKSSIYVVDNYIGLRTLVHLKNSLTGVNITLFSDNVGNNKLHNIEFTDFCKEYPSVKISMKKTGGIFHDRFIVLDYGTADERVVLQH